MKIVKLNRRYKMYDCGYTHALRWDSWGFNNIGPYEQFLIDAHRFHGYRTTGPWYSGFGTRSPKTGYKPYYIYVRNENMITALLLSVTK